MFSTTIQGETLKGVKIPHGCKTPIIQTKLCHFSKRQYFTNILMREIIHNLCPTNSIRHTTMNYREIFTLYVT
jgi:hypothetical protein